MEFHVMFTLCVAVILNAVLCSGNPPKITHNPKEFLPYPDNSLVVKAGSNFNLLCEGESHVNWSLPTYHTAFGVSDTSTFANISGWIQYDNMRPYVANIYMEEVSFSDTGYYICRTAGATSDEDLDHIAKTYVFVKDKDEPLTEIPHLVRALQYGSVVIPCRPTSPEINVTLWKDSDRIDNVPTSYGNSMDVTYDRTLGFTLENLNIINGGMYECRAVQPDNDEEFERFTTLVVLSHTDMVPKPSINGSNLHQVEGSRLVLECTVVMGNDISFSLNWTVVPNGRDVESKRVVISDAKLKREPDSTGVTKQVASRLLTIKKTVLSDSGQYVCEVKDHTQKSNTANVSLSIFGAEIRYINLTKQAPITVDYGVSEVKWIIPYMAYPAVNLTWISPHGIEITKDNRHNINYSEYEAKLVISKPQLKDAGDYKLRAVNSVLNETLNLSLRVRVRPTVKLTTPGLLYYTEKGTYNMTCEAVGYPVPVILWSFKRCDNPRTCQNSTWNVIDSSAVTEQVEGFKVVSMLLKKATPSSGYISCVANNSLGSEEKSTTFWISDVPNGFNFERRPEEIVEGDSVTLECRASMYNYTNGFVWYFTPKASITRLTINSNASDYVFEGSSTLFSYRSKLMIKNMNRNHSGIYTCEVKTNTQVPEIVSYLAIVKPVTKPTIKFTNMNNSEVLVNIGERKDWGCSGEGVPRPVITWYKDDILVEVANSTLYELRDSNETLVVLVSKSVTEGTYMCLVENKAGKDWRTMILKLKDKPKPHVGIIVAVVVISIILCFMIVFLIYKIRKEQKLRRELRTIGLDQFDKGALENINPDLPIDDQAELLPYDRKWEFPREKLRLGKQLGAGAFGVVMKADAVGITEGEAISTVAVKMVKRNADYTYIKALASELKIMVHLGKHLNVVNLLGACTKNLTKRELYVIVEYCRFGNLHNYLLRHRSDFIDQIDPVSGLIDPNLGADIMARHEANNRASNSVDMVPGQSSSGDYRSPGQSSSSAESDVALISMTPTGGEDGMMLSNNSIQPEWRSNYRGDYKGNVRPICTRDLLCYAFQVARGMEYLAGRKVLHGDLAARNILLSEDNIVKICDFGLAKSMYKSDNYRKKGDGPLPVKWMAVESIRDRVFSTQSDIWSFGIVLWEFFSLARTPYPGMEADEKLYNKLIEGYRMDKPEFATKDVYTIMENCWLAKPTERPSFNDLSSQLGSMLEESVRSHYIDLNEPYIDMNVHWKDGQPSDYLAMMTAPTYDNMLSPGAGSVEDVHQYVNGCIVANQDRPMSDPELGENSGYLCMKSAPEKEVNIFSPRNVESPIFNFSPQQRRFVDDKTKEEETHPMLNEYKSPSVLPQPVNNLNKDSDRRNINVEEKRPNITPSFSNPSYQSMGPITPALDNYVNMPQQKLAGVKSEEPICFSNPNYVSMGIPPDNNNQNSILFTNIKDGEGYVNLPKHGHNLSDGSSGFQSDLGENSFLSVV